MENQGQRRARLLNEEKELKKDQPVLPSQQPEFVWKEFIAEHTGLSRKKYVVNGKEVLLRARQVYKYKEYVND